ncbi:helix-turn-helix domain-containing protein [Deinococcus marmoris]|uniref:helix-turn-helix domain-containing protein n=1 Tax=Deinococcus marmoris TaxID=249408 RepID=UPI0011152963|nr:helix-turn-helix transcriptional regulator [Deinococcus marmoris]
MISVAGEKVRAARLAAGIRSVQAAARAAHLNYKTIEAFEGRGDAKVPTNPKMETLLALAAAYGCSPRDFTENPEEWDRAAQALGLPATLGAVVGGQYIEPALNPTS